MTSPPAFTFPPSLSILRKPQQPSKQPLHPSSNRPSVMAQDDGYNRIKIPFIIDALTVTNPKIMKTITEHPDIARPQETGLPPAFNLFIVGTQFFSKKNDEYALAFQTTGADDQAERRDRVLRNLKDGFSDDEVQQLAQLVKNGESREVVARKMFQTVGHIVTPLEKGESPPDDILDALADLSLTALLNPVGYFKARRARKKVEQWVTDAFPDEQHPVDVLHDMATIYQGFSSGLVTLRDWDGKDISSFLTQNPILPVSFRTVAKTTSIDGLFEKDPLVKEKTLIVLLNGTAAIESKDDRYVWGLGSEERLCPFRPVFYDAADKIAKANQE